MNNKFYSNFWFEDPKNYNYIFFKVDEKYNNKFFRIYENNFYLRAKLCNKIIVDIKYYDDEYLLFEYEIRKNVMYINKVTDI